MKKNTGVFILACAILFLSIYLVSIRKNKTPLPQNTNSTSQVSEGVGINSIDMPGIQKGNYPWMAEKDNLEARLAIMNLPLLKTEGSVLHTHQHINIFIDGIDIPVPAGIGVSKDGAFSIIHTHDEDQIIHIESPYRRDFTLGEFFDIWGVFLSDTCIGGYCETEDKKLTIYLNGTKIEDNFKSIKLEPHTQITVTYGEAPKDIPVNYSFPKGL